MAEAALSSSVSVTETLLEKLEEHDECLDTIWMLLAATLVFFMHAGFSLLETGCVQYKNAQNILAKNLVVVTFGFLCWYFFGWAIAFGPDVGWAMDGFFDDKTLFRQWFFQGAFCATASTIVSGAIAERTKLGAFGAFIVIMTSIVYPVVIYWGWSGEGFLSNSDGSAFGPAYMDFAGSGLVHMVGGVAALCASAIVGPRLGRFHPDTPKDAFAPHNVPFCVIGTFFLWFGWYGFNPGSTLEMHQIGDATTAGLVAANTTLAPCCGGLVVFLLRRFAAAPQALDVPGFCNGLLAGLVGITAACGTVKCWEAMIIGAVAGLVYQGWSMAMVLMKLDDVVDAVAVHGACGIWGVLALGLFGDPDEGNGGNGLFYGGDQLWTQFMAVICISAWTAVWTIGVFLPLRLFGMVRLSDEFQEIGADMKEHSPSKGYTMGHDSGRSATAALKECGLRVCVGCQQLLAFPEHALKETCKSSLVCFTCGTDSGHKYLHEQPQAHADDVATGSAGVDAKRPAEALVSDPHQPLTRAPFVAEKSLVAVVPTAVAKPHALTSNGDVQSLALAPDDSEGDQIVIESPHLHATGAITSGDNSGNAVKECSDAVVNEQLRDTNDGKQGPIDVAVPTTHCIPSWQPARKLVSSSTLEACHTIFQRPGGAGDGVVSEASRLSPQLRDAASTLAAADKASAECTLQHADGIVDPTASSTSTGSGAQAHVPLSVSSNEAAAPRVAASARPVRIDRSHHCCAGFQALSAQTKRQLRDMQRPAAAGTERTAGLSRGDSQCLPSLAAGWKWLQQEPQQS